MTDGLEMNRPAATAATPVMGTATFLMTDIAGSTRLWEQESEAMPVALAAHDAILRSSVERFGGTVVKTTGDGILARFDESSDAVAAAVESQCALHARRWELAAPLRVRAALHSGSAQAREGDYFGPALNRVARLLALGHGGQVLLSGVAAALAGDRLGPGAALRDLGEHRLRDLEQAERVFQLTVPDLPSEFPPLRSSLSGLTNLPTQLTSFVGRARELGAVSGLLGSNRLVTLIGVGGTGKTRLMLQVATAAAARYRDGAWLVELAPISDADLVVLEVARALGVREEPGRPVLASVVDFLRFKELLLLIDNCEHVISAVADLADGLLAACPALVVVATSREALGVAGESVFQVPSLAVPAVVGPSPEHGGVQASTAIDEASLRDLAGVDAVRLFVERASAGVPGFALTRGNASSVVEICRRLDGIPLAIELAAARVAVLSPQEIATRLGDRFRLLTGGRRTAVPRQQTLQALIDWSWDLLTDADRQLLRRLSVFLGGWTLAAADATAGEGSGDSTLDTLDGLECLAARSMISVDRGLVTRYGMLETIRQYARDRLLESGEGPAIRARHLGFFLAMVREAGPALRGPLMMESLERLDADADNLRASLDWASESDPEAALWFCAAMRHYWQLRSEGMEGVEQTGRAVRLLRALPPAPPETSRERAILTAEVLSTGSYVWGSLGAGGATTLSWARAALEIARGLGEPRTLLHAFEAHGLTEAFAGLMFGVEGVAEEAEQLAESPGDWAVVAYVHSGLGVAAAWAGQGVSDERFITATDAAMRSGNPAAIAFVALTWGRALGMAGRVDEARPYFHSAFTRFSEIGDRRLSLGARSDLAHALRRAGAFDEAEMIYRETIHGWERLGNRGAIAHQLESFAYLVLERGDAARTAELFAAADGLREASGAVMLAYERAEHDAAQARVEAILDPAGLEAARRRGRRLNAGEAVSRAIGT